jgi:hypothetical protein
VCVCIRKRLNFLNVSLIFPGKLNSVFQNFHFLLLAFRFVSFQIQFNSSSDQLNLLEVQITHVSFNLIWLSFSQFLLWLSFYMVLILKLWSCKTIKFLALNFHQEHRFEAHFFVSCIEFVASLILVFIFFAGIDWICAILFLEINRFRREDRRKTETIFKVLYSNLPK